MILMIQRGYHGIYVATLGQNGQVRKSGNDQEHITG